MGKKDRSAFLRKRAQKIAKQKTKKARELASARQRVPLEYTGKRYQSRRFTYPLMMVEVGIRNADRAAGGKLRDSEVRGALSVMIKQLHRGPQDVVEGLDLLHGVLIENAAQQRIVEHIVAEWLDYFKLNPVLPRADAVGILRTLVHSLGLRTEMHPGGRGYLDFLEDFLPELDDSRIAGATEEIIELWSRQNQAWNADEFDDDFEEEFDGIDEDDEDDPSTSDSLAEDGAIDVEHRAPAAGQPSAEQSG